MSTELEGLEPRVIGGHLVGYTIQAGQGPTQVAQDINNPQTMKEYGYTLQKPVTWGKVVVDNMVYYMEAAQWSENPNFANKNNPTYTKLNSNIGDKLNLYIPVEERSIDLNRIEEIVEKSKEESSRNNQKESFFAKNSYGEVDYNLIVGGGIRFGLGYVTDSNGDTGIYGAFGGGVGFDLGLGLTQGYIEPTDGEFLLEHWEGSTNYINYGLSTPFGGIGKGVEGTVGEGINDKDHGLLSKFNSDNFGTGINGYKTGSNSFGPQKPAPKFRFGGSIGTNKSIILFDFSENN